MSNLIKNQDIISIIHLYLLNKWKIEQSKINKNPVISFKVISSKQWKQHDIKLKVNKSEQCIEVEASA